jgi:hypothetical protein
MDLGMGELKVGEDFLEEEENFLVPVAAGET